MLPLMQKALQAALAVAVVAPGLAVAQSYPSKPIQLIVPFATGGTTDIIARAVAPGLSKALGQQVIVVNKAGGGGTIGATEIARAAPDGYTLGIATVSTTASNPAVNPAISYNPLTDFTPITNIAATPNIITVHPSFPAKNFKDFLAAVKAKPGQYSFGSSGVGGIAHLQMELFKNLSGTYVIHIPYRGSGPALTDAVSGQVPVLFDNLPSTLPFVRDGRLIPIVVAAPQRLPYLPNVPTFKEVGLEPVNRMAYYGIHGPKGLPKEVVDKVYAAVKTALDDPATRKRIDDSGSLVVANTPEQFAAQIKAEYETYLGVVKAQKIKLD